MVAGNSGFLDTDINGDGSVDAYDYLMLEPNVSFGITGQTP